MKNFFGSNIQEINNFKFLGYFGASLALSHILTGHYWLNIFSFEKSICWSFWPQCQTTFEFWSGYEKWILWSYMGLSVLCTVLFVSRRNRYAYSLFLFLSLLKLIIQISDYRLMGNYHYMVNIVNFAYLLLPYKEATIKVLIIMFYFSAGIIKFNTDWLSGMSMLRPPIISGKILELACAGVIFLEVVFSFALASRNRFIFWPIFFLFVIFHVFSWHVVGHFYPQMMFSMLSIFVLSPLGIRAESGAYLGLVVIAFMTPQFYVLLRYPQSSLSGEGRILSLNMLDAFAVCEATFYIKKKNEIIEYSPVFRHGVRIHCDPLIATRHLELTCQNLKRTADFIDIDFSLQVARRSQPEKIVHFLYKNACTHKLNISFLGTVSQND